MRQRKLITIVIETNNAAFDNHEGGEVSRILRNLCRELAKDMRTGENGLYDINGDTVGRFIVESL